MLGLVKAQQVKNAVIVPMGAKGGFVPRKMPVGGSRDEVMAEGIACYRIFISGLLDITDNLKDGEVVPPQNVVRHDADDPYLVVAADKGTATFSDIANGCLLYTSGVGLALRAERLVGAGQQVEQLQQALLAAPWFDLVMFVVGEHQAADTVAVSYTHLDVYKRQRRTLPSAS